MLNVLLIKNNCILSMLFRIYVVVGYLKNTRSFRVIVIVIVIAESVSNRNPNRLHLSCKHPIPGY